MDKWQQRLMENLLRENNRKKELISLLESFPEGCLVTQKKGNYLEYYIYFYKNGKRKSRYLSKERDKELIEIMKHKKEAASGIKKEISFISEYIKALYPIAKQICDEFSLPDKLFPPSFSQKEDRKEQLTILTDRGEMVRSKSEKFIADTLYKFNLDYRYEQVLNLGGVIFYPDFTVISPLNGQKYFWEHLGLRNERYLLDWENRRCVYDNHGIKEGRNLIVTTEDDTNNFNRIIGEIFTMRRYIDFVP